MLNLFQHPSLDNHRHMPVERNPCAYILASQPRGPLYISVTSDLEKRLWRHRATVTGGFVARYKVYRLVRFEIFGTMESAILSEKRPPHHGFSV